MGLRVQIAFDQSATQPVNFFRLDDPEAGVLDGPYVLGGDILIDVTDKVRAVQVRRGRSRQLEKFTAGNANITIDNRDRSFDPLYAAGPYFGQLVPKKQVVIDLDDEPIFTGSVADWNLSYDVNGNSIAEPSCTDAFDTFASQLVPAGTATSQLTGARVAQVLTDISWPTARRDIATGQATLNADVIADNVNALAYLSKIADVSEPGALFMGKAGEVVFRDRADLQGFTSSVQLGGTGIPMTGMQVVYGVEEMANSVEVTYTAGSVVAGTAIATDTTSVTAYGEFAKQIDTLLADATQAQALADWTAVTYGQPKYRIDQVTVNIDALGTAQTSQVIGLELADVVLVEFTPNGIGPAIQQYVTIDAIEHSITPARHDITFTMSETLAAFILDSSTFGVLDDDSLGF